MSGAEEEDESSTAPSYIVPEQRIVSVEHPCIVKNFDNGFRSLGGEAHLRHAIKHRVGDSLKKVNGQQKVLVEPVVGVSFRPNDPLAKRLPSTGIDTRNVLIRVTVPKRTGRKRKRGSDEPFTLPAEPEPRSDSFTAPQLFQRLRDREDDYSIEAVGMIRETHRFRNLPDYQSRGDDVAIMRELRDHAIAVRPSYDRLRRFHVDIEPGSRDDAAFSAPPVLAPTDQPYRYYYQQEASVTYSFDEYGNPIAENHSRPPRRMQEAIATDAEEVPQAPPPELRQRSMSGTSVPRCVEDIKKILEERPIVTRRVLANLLPNYSESILKESVQWVGYSFNSGPWRDSVIKFGVDPRKDPKCRFWQTLSFQIDKDIIKGTDKTGQWSRTMRYHAEAQAHIFDGLHITANGKTWQLCDISEPMLREQVNTENLRSECELQQWGWYHASPLAKIRVVMRDMTRYLFTGAELPMDDYRFVLTLPDKYSDRVKRLNDNIDKGCNQHVMELLRDWTSVAKAGIVKRRLNGMKPERNDELDEDAEAWAEQMQGEGSDDDGDGDEPDRDMGNGDGSGDDEAD